MSIGGSWDARAAQAEHIGPTDTGDNIEAKRVAGYKWNGTSWERDAVGFANNADITTTIAGDTITQTDGTKTLTITISGGIITEVWT